MVPFCLISAKSSSAFAQDGGLAFRTAMQVSQQSLHEVRMVLQQARLRPEPPAQQPPPVWHPAMNAPRAPPLPEVAPLPPLPAIHGHSNVNGRLL